MNSYKILLLSLLSILIFITCKEKEDDNPTIETVIPILEDVGPFSSDSKTASFTGEIKNFEALIRQVSDYGFAWSEETFNDLDAPNVVSLGALGSKFFHYDQVLEPNRIYHLKAYIIYDGETYISNEGMVYTRKGHWEEVATFPAAHRLKATAFVIDDKAYIAGGGTDEVWMYDPINDTWTQKASLPRALENPVSFVLDGEGYVGLNLGGAYTFEDDDFWKYNPTTDSWSPIASLSSFQGGIIQKATAAFALDGKGYVQSKSAFLSIYDPQIDEWKYAEPINNHLNNEDDHIVISNGVDSVFTIYNDRVQLFTTNPDNWEWMDDFHTSIRLNGNEDKRSAGIGFYVDGTFVAGMGINDNDRTYYDLYEYAYGSWGHPLNFLEREDYGWQGLHQGVSFAVNGKGYIGLGSFQRSLNNGIETFDNLRFWSFDLK